MLVIASVTEQVATWATHVVRDVGLPGIFLLMVLESACVPVPSEATMLFAGFNVATGHYSLLAITVAGVAGNLVGSLIAYAVGWFGRIELLEKHGRALHVSPRQLARADRWFERWGAPTVLICRVLPIIRTFISLPAGVARMPIWRFTALTLIGCLPWVFGLGLAGRLARSHWTSWKHSLHYVDYAVLALVAVGAVVLLVRWRRSRPGRREATADASG